MVLGIHTNSKVVTPTDSTWFLHIAMSAIKERNLNLDEYAHLILVDDYRVYRKEGHIYSSYPVATALIATPVLFLIDRYLFYFHEIDLFESMRGSSPSDLVWGIHKFISSLFIALTSILLYYIAVHSVSCTTAFFVVFVFAFCTSLWSSVTRILWSHSPVVFLVTLSLFIFTKSRLKLARLFLGTTILMLACFFRPIMILPTICFTIYSTIHYRKIYQKTFFGIFFLVLLFGVYFLTKRHSPSYTHFFDFFDIKKLFLPFFKKDFYLILLGVILSPNRGLFFFTPVLVFSLYGIVLKVKERWFSGLDLTVLSAIILYLIAICYPLRRYQWWAGYAFGPRFFSDIIPYFVYFLIPLVKEISFLPPKNKLLTSLFLFSIILSFYIHYRGANIYATWQWNWIPESIDQSPSRVWDWKDIQFLRK